MGYKHNSRLCCLLFKIFKRISLFSSSRALVGSSAKIYFGFIENVIATAIMGILDDSYCLSGSIYLDNKVLNDLKPNKRRELCGKTIGYIPQNPMTAFDPRIKIGKQVEETLCIRLSVSKYDASNIFLEYLKILNLDDAKRIMENYPAEISGGMLQRITSSIIITTF